MRDGTIVVAGASLAALRGAEALRARGFSGRLVLVGDEPHRPYDRPPLSKHVLTGEIAPEATTLPGVGALRAEWRLGAPVTGLDRAGRALLVGGGERLPFDRLLIATGARARPWPVPDEAALAGVHTVRSRDDAAALAAGLAARPERVLILGAGFIGCEVASSIRALGLPVTVADPAPSPLAGPLGPVIGGFVAGRMEAAGIDLRVGTEVAHLEGAAGRVRGARLTDGGTIAADLVVVALGAVRNTEWLAGSGLDADEGGLSCDGACRALDEAGRPDDAIFAAGDVARCPHPLFGGRPVALEHWGNAVAQAAHAARAMIDGPEAAGRYAEVPAFWSSQFGLTIKSLGLTEGADAVAVVQGHPRTGRFLAVYGREGHTVAAVSVDAGRWLPAYEAPIREGAPFPPIVGGADQPSVRPVPSGLPALQPA
ncbi:NAD(P)/FAD-dependent oxidoreductase [Methylobacterium platani]|uniref:Ferredoxin reductase n=2 Tax=Methylobacterium platani TaxID=427683 RepID=A0A179SCW4_9HYPH|nr:FAD-dependent oxidoreductase [Methylobacterium platani]KMO21877.1 ferredoxin reductase [Methylobacterium platani JCM 14648]OAS24687.1 ferredoxin reductase [Methylobacterium platani]